MQDVFLNRIANIFITKKFLAEVHPRRVILKPLALVPPPKAAWKHRKNCGAAGGRLKMLLKASTINYLFEIRATWTVLKLCKIFIESADLWKRKMAGIQPKNAIFTQLLPSVNYFKNTKTKTQNCNWINFINFFEYKIIVVVFIDIMEIIHFRKPVVAAGSSAGGQRNR